MTKNLPVRHVFLLVLFTSLFYLTQAQDGGRIATPDQLKAVGPPSVEKFQDNYQRQDLVQSRQITGNQEMVTQEKPQNGARVNAVAPVQIGRSSNVFSSIRNHQNQVYANDSTGLVAFIHRQDITIWGGGAQQNGMLRYDFSVDRGVTFNTDIGPVNQTYTLPARYPNLSMANPTGQANPFSAELVYTAPTVDVNSAWDGFVGGKSLISPTSPPTATDSYYAFGNSNIASSLAQGLPEEYWMAEHLYDGNAFLDTIRLFKGVWDPQAAGGGDVVWAQGADIVPNWYTGFDGSIYSVGPVVAFSPDGQHGWVGLLGDLVGGSDSVMNPIFIHSTDGGGTWGAPMEVDMSTIPWISDSLRRFWVDSSSNPVSTGRATCAFDFDLTVDNLGNPHLAVVVGSAASTGNTPGYSIFSGLTKYLLDFTTTNGGASFDAHMVSPVVTFRGSFGTGNPVDMDNQPQISRNESGELIFYSWADSDTSWIGFGSADNIAPQLFISGLRVSDGYRTCNKNLTGGDLIWDGRALFPTMAPTVLTGSVNGFGCYGLPIVMVEMITNDPLGPTQYWYFGNDASFGISDFLPPASVVTAFGQTCTSSGCGFPPVNSFISGKVWADSNANGIQEPNEPNRPNVIVEALPGPWFGVTDALGEYVVGVPNGTYTVSVVPPLYHNITFPASPNTYSATVSSGANSTGNDFGLQAIPNVVDLRVWISSTQHRPGFNACHTLGVTNVGTTTESGTLHYDYGNILTYVSSSPTFTTHNGIDSLTWDFQNLAPGQTAGYSACFNVPQTTTLGTVITTMAEVMPSGGELTVANNRDSLNDVVIGSYDPNDKMVFPAGVGTQGIIDAGDWLTYQIRFQNTGTASAINVFIRDTLDEDFDISTFDMIAASHPYRLEMDGHGYVTWYFDNINLPDSNSNEPASHGFIKYRIQNTTQLHHWETDFNKHCCDLL